MHKLITRSASRYLAPAALGLLAFGCGGGGGGGGGSSGDFRVTNVNLGNNSVWFINRPITIEFNQPVDFNTVSLNSINIRKLTGAPAVGEFSLVSPNMISFQPLCPRLADFSDAGLAPGGVAYELRIFGHSTFSVRSTSGDILDTSEQRLFSTPNSTDPAALFFDQVNGSPLPVVRASTSVTTAASYVELGGDPSARVYFERDPFGVFGLEGGYLLPLNLLSDTTTKVAYMIAFNQPVDPRDSNIDSSRLRLEYNSDPQGSSTWLPLTSQMTLVENCEGTGSLVRIEPEGSLPPGSSLRCFVGPDFRDIVGETNSVTQTSFAPAETDVVVGVLADSLEEEFLIGGTAQGSREDVSAPLGLPLATWGAGELATAFDFTGTGGLDGTFDWEVKAGQQVVLDTTLSTIVGGPGFAPTSQQVVVGGVLDLRNFRVAAGGTLRVQGPNPLLILASGTVEINGLIEVSGIDSKGVVTLNTTNVPEPGAPGVAGGGRGGFGSPLSNSSSPSGTNGEGAFGVQGIGGGGGDTTFWTGGSNNVDARRGAGGGGGVLGPNQVGSSPPLFDQTFIGLDAEPGFNNLFVATGTQPIPISAVTGTPPSRGGVVGLSPFADASTANDFFGSSFNTTTSQVTVGELSQPWAGAGGGGGGDAAWSSGAPFPVVPFDPGGDEKAAGGGGGGGSVQILALGNISFGAAGSLKARGGTGGGGENTNFVDRVGGGSGGASGGHVVLQTAGKIDFTAVTGATSVAIITTGGQGGAGAGNFGGAQIGSGGALETTPLADACPTGYPTSVCRGPVSGAGGDGGPGIIQLHAPAGLGGGDILLPVGKTLAQLCKPTPVSATSTERLIPTFGRASVARSLWIPMGLAGFDPNAVAPPFFKPSTFDFGGVDLVTGEVLTTSGIVDLGPTLLGPAAISVAPALPFISASGRTMNIDATPLIGGPQEYFLGNPGLLKRSTLLLSQVGTPTINQRFDVVSAVYVSSAIPPTLQLTVSSTGPLLTTFTAPGGVNVEVIPTYFKIATDGVLDSLPTSAGVVLKFQAAPATVSGLPDEAFAVPPIPGSDVSLLNTSPINADFRFLRFQVEFDIDKIGAGISPSTPLPAVDFLRLPFRF